MVSSVFIVYVLTVGLSTLHMIMTHDGQ